MPNVHKTNRQNEKYRLLLCQDIGLVKGKKKTTNNCYCFVVLEIFFLCSFFKVPSD